MGSEIITRIKSMRRYRLALSDSGKHCLMKLTIPRKISAYLIRNCLLELILDCTID